MPERPRVFISYSHDPEENKAQVRALADRLRADGVDCTIDQDVPHPADGWPSWSHRQIEEAKFVLVVCTEAYFRRATGRERSGAGRGATFESALILRALYDARMSNEKFLPVLFDDADEQLIPLPLKGYSFYRIDAEDEGYRALLRCLTRQPVQEIVNGQETPATRLEKRPLSIGRRLRRQWRWGLVITLLASLGLAGTWWILHQRTKRAELYQRALQAMAVLELPAARDDLERAVSSGKDLPLERSAFAQVLVGLRETEGATAEAKRAFAARQELADEDRELVEARYHRIQGNWLEAERKYQNLLKKKPDEVEYALGLAEALIAQGQHQRALTIVAKMQRTSQDLRLDLLEAQAAYGDGESTRQLAAASRAVVEAERRGLALLAAKGLLLRGIAHSQRGEFQRAIDDFNNSLKRSGARNPVLAAEAQNGIAIVRYGQGDLIGAERWYRRALDSYHALGDRIGEADQRTNLVSVYAEQGKLGQARAEYERALMSSGSGSEKADALGNLGWVLYQQGDLAQAAEHLQGAIAILLEDEREGRAFELCRLAQVFTDSLELASAKRALAECLELARRDGDERVDGLAVADARTVEAKLFFIQGDLNGAWGAQRDALKTYKRLGMDRETAWSQLGLAAIQLERNLALEARSLIEPALAHFRGQRSADDKGLAQAALASAYLAQGATSRARSLIDEAKERVADSELLELRVQVAIAEAHVLAAMKNVAGARDVIQRELDEPRMQRCPRLRLEARLAQGEIEMVYGDSSTGRELLSRLEGDAEGRGYRLVAAKAARLLAKSAAAAR